MIDAVGVERRCAALDAVDLVALLEQKLGQIRAVLARDAGDQRLLACCLSAFNRRSQRTRLRKHVLLNESAAADVLQVVARNSEALLAAVENVIGQDAAVRVPQQAFRLAAVVAQVFVERRTKTR